MTITKEMLAIVAADTRLSKAGLPSYTELLSLVLHSLTTKDRKNLDDTERHNPGANDCGDFVLMTPAAWGAIKRASAPFDA